MPSNQAKMLLRGDTLKGWRPQAASEREGTEAVLGMQNFSKEAFHWAAVAACAVPASPGYGRTARARVNTSPGTKPEANRGTMGLAVEAAARIMPRKVWTGAECLDMAGCETVQVRDIAERNKAARPEMQSDMADTGKGKGTDTGRR
jgi:hypothetical protein